ncbi:DUF190 domain-containing protein [Acidiphilium sp. AL]|nr:DUF190 domain-containing protein [Acidiphilium sp. AL]
MEDAILLRIFLGEDDMIDGKPLYRAVIEYSRKAGLAGATALPAPLGFGISRVLRSGLNLDVGIHLPIVVEIVDRTEKIEAFLPIVDDMMQSGPATIERARVLHYGRKKPGLIECFRQQFFGQPMHS